MLSPPPAVRSGIIFLDVPSAALAHIPGELRGRAQALSTFAPAGDAGLFDRLATVAELVARLASAELLVTRRLHAALPAASFGTPVVAIPDPDIAWARERFDGVEGVFPVVYTDEAAQRLPRLNWQTIAVPKVRPDLVIAHDLLRSRLRQCGISALGPPCDPNLDRLGRDRVRIAHPWPQWPRARFRLRLAQHTQDLPVRFWSGSFVDLGLRCFPGLSRFTLRLEGMAGPGDAWIDLGALQLLAAEAAQKFAVM
jgi:hypothetical protein